MATLEERIASIDAILDRGISEVELSDGRREQLDLAELRKQRDRLAAQLSASTKTSRRIIHAPTSGIEC